jgi:hypothetical protein
MRRFYNNLYYNYHRTKVTRKTGIAICKENSCSFDDRKNRQTPIFYIPYNLLLSPPYRAETAGRRHEN